MALAFQASHEPGTGLTLVPLAEAHKEATLRWMNDPRLMPALNRLHLISAAEHNGWFATLAHRSDLQCFAILGTGPSHHLGNVWLHAVDPVHRKAEVRIMLDPEHQNRGVGSRALSLLRNVATSRGISRLYAYTLVSNVAAQRAFTRAGFRPEGLLRGDRWDGEKFLDVILFGSERTG